MLDTRDKPPRSDSERLSCHFEPLLPITSTILPLTSTHHALNIHAIGLNINTIGLNIHTIALNIHTIALNIHTISLNIHTIALNIHTITLNIHTIALNIHTLQVGELHEAEPFWFMYFPTGSPGEAARLREWKPYGASGERTYGSRLTSFREEEVQAGWGEGQPQVMEHPMCRKWNTPCVGNGTPHV